MNNLFNYENFREVKHIKKLFDLGTTIKDIQFAHNHPIINDFQIDLQSDYIKQLLIINYRRLMSILSHMCRHLELILHLYIYNRLIVMMPIGAPLVNYW